MINRRGFIDTVAAGVPMLFMSGESVVPLKMLDVTVFPGPQTVILTCNGKVIAEAIIPHLTDAVKRYR